MYTFHITAGVNVPLGRRLKAHMSLYHTDMTLPHICHFLSLCDRRQRTMGAMLEGVRVIKLSAWEAEVQKTVESARKDELSFVRKSAMFMAGNRALMDASPVCICILYISLCIHIYAYIYMYTYAYKETNS